MFFQKIEKCRAFCRGRTCTVGKIQMVFRRIRGWPGNPPRIIRGRGIRAPGYSGLSAQNMSRFWSGKIGMSKNRRQGIWTEPLRLVRRGLRWAQRKIRWTSFHRLRDRVHLLVGLPGKGVKNTPFHTRCETLSGRVARSQHCNPL